MLKQFGKRLLFTLVIIIPAILVAAYIPVSLLHYLVTGKTFYPLLLSKFGRLTEQIEMAEMKKAFENA